MDPRVASELSLRIPHLALRMREHSARAQRYAGARLLLLIRQCCY
jgi:methionine-gamma-lyase